MCSKNIWYISKYVVPNYAAKVGARGFMLLRELSLLGYNCVLITSDSNHLANVPQVNDAFKDEVVDGVFVRWLKTSKYKKAKSIYRIISWFDFEVKLFFNKKHNLPAPDYIIISSLSLLTILNGIYLKRRYKCKLIFEIRDIWPLLIQEVGGYSRFNLFIYILRKLEVLGYRKSDLIVGTMPNLVEHVREVEGNTRVECIPMGYSQDMYACINTLSEDYVRKYIPRNKFVVCYAGSIGLDNALEALLECSKIMDNNNDIHFLVVGSGDLREKYIAKTKSQNNITFAPRVEKEQVQDLLKYADILYFAVHPALVLKYGQSLNKLIDYMYSGKPIVASYTGFPTMINEAGCGTYVKAGDVKGLKNTLLEYSKKPATELSEIGNKGREWILSERSYSKLALEYSALLKGV